MTSEEEDLSPAGMSESVQRRIAFLCLLCGLPVFLIVAHFAGVGRGRAAGLCAAVDSLVVVFRCGSRKKMRLWSAISLTLLIQIMVIVLVPFGDESLPAYALLPAALAIYLFDEGVIYLFGARSAGKHPPSSATN